MATTGMTAKSCSLTSCMYAATRKMVSDPVKVMGNLEYIFDLEFVSSKWLKRNIQTRYQNSIENAKRKLN